MQSKLLLQSLRQQTTEIRNRVQGLNHYDIRTLTWRESPASWSILECLEHLNLYGDYYLPQIEQAINSARTGFETDFKSGALGSYFAKSMLPKQKLNRMKTFKDKNPLNAALDKGVIARFDGQQARLLELLGNAENVSLGKVKIPTSISRLIRLKLGDTFQFYINHILRHLQQVDRVALAMKSARQPAGLPSQPAVVVGA